MPGLVFQTNYHYIIINKQSCFYHGAIPLDLTTIGGPGMVEYMDKQKGLDILGLRASATRMDARKAFRTLAKRFHPDKFANDPLRLKAAEEKMKQVNEAFCFLLPLLPDPGDGQKPLVSDCDCRANHGKGQTFVGFFSSLIAGLKQYRDNLKGFNAGDTGGPGQTGPPCANAKNTACRFESVFQDAVNRGQAGASPRCSPAPKAPGRYAHYRQCYGSASLRQRSGSRKNSRTGPVEAISPVAPVSSVKR